MSKALELMDEIERWDDTAVGEGGGSGMRQLEGWQSLRAEVERLEAQLAEAGQCNQARICGTCGNDPGFIAGREAQALFAVAEECESEQANTGRARSYRDRMRRTKQVLLWHANRKKAEADRLRSEPPTPPSTE